ncbi:hypothetical protein [Candidatus Protochlamydia phocaeensis]|uniref:hypothetical protein n=1 Tax=Candidatus Protochlamydia phocaeensis TaxID=1414722 RepID=UPI0008386130|nr:hypothetical protein [Candidatus Protochlamydia phocaeensis]
MANLPLGLSYSLHQNLQEFKEEKKIVEHLENNPLDLKDFINAFVQDLEWVNNQKNKKLDREIIRLTLENAAVEAEVVLKIFEVIEKSDSFKEIFHEEMESFPALFDRCLKVLKSNQEWMETHQAATHSIVKNFIHHHIDKKSPELQKRVNELASFISSFSLFKAADDAPALLNQAISRKNIPLIKLLIKQGILENERLNKSSLFTAVISIPSFEIFNLLIDHGVGIEGDGSREIQVIISKYGDLDAFLKKYGKLSNESSTREEINNLKNIAFFLIVRGYKIPEEKKKSSSLFGNYGREYGRYDNSNHSEEEFRRELLQVAKLHQELTGSETPYLKDLDAFYRWASHFPAIHSWMDQRSSLVLDSLLSHSSKASPETQKGLLKILEEMGLLSSENYSTVLKRAIDQNPSLLKTLCQFKPPDNRPIADLDHLTPLQYAFEKKSIESASILFDFDSNPNIVLPGSRLSFIAFIISRLTQFKDQQSPALDLLNKALQHNLDLQSLPQDQATQIWNDLMQWKNPSSERIINQLLDRGLPFLLIRDPKSQDSSLLMALKSKKFKVAEKLMAMGAHTPLINDPNKKGITPLSLALEIGEDDLIQFLLDDGADISPLQSDWQLRQLGEFQVQREKQDPKQALRDLVNTKNLANLLADNFMKDMKDDRGERLEGNNFVQSLYFINSLLGSVMQEAETDPEIKHILIHKQDQKERFDSLSKQLAQCAEFADQLAAIQIAPRFKKQEMLQTFSKRLSHQINRLREGESLVLPSGWSAENGGHAMLCVFRCVGQGKYDCLSINTGDGVEHHAFLPKPNKTYINPICCYKDLSQEEATDSTFLQALFEPRINPEQKDSNYSSLDLYDGIFARFKDKLVTTSPEMNLYITAQRSGSCSIRVLLAYMHVMLGEESYKPTAYFLKKTALSAAIENENLLKDQPVLQHILRKSAESLCRNILKLSKDNLHSSHFLEDNLGEMTLGDISEALEEEKISFKSQEPPSEQALLSLLERLEKRIQEKNPEQIKATRLPIREAARGLITAFQIFRAVGMAPSSIGTRHPDFSFPLIAPLNTLALSQSLESLFKQVEKSQGLSTVDLQLSDQPHLKILTPSHIAELRGNSLVDHLEVIRKFCVSQNQGTAKEREMAVELATQTLLNLPLPTGNIGEAWEEFSIGQAEKSLLHIYAISRNLLFNMQSSPIAFPERIIALYKAQAIAFKLACQIEKENFPNKEFKLENFCIDYTPLLNLKTDVHNVIYDTQTRHKLNELLEYMRLAHPSKPPSYTLFNYIQWKREGPEIELPIPKDSGESFYLQDIHDAISTWEKEDREYENLNYDIKRKISRQEWHLAKLWEGKTGHAPTYFLIQRDLSLFSQILENVSAFAWQEYCNYSSNKFLIQINTSDKTAKVFIQSQGKWAASTPLRIGRHTPKNTDPSNSYSSTHFAFGNKEKSKALYPQESQNAYTIKYTSELESLFSLTSQPLLTPYHIRMWLSSHLNDILDRDNQVFCSLALFSEERLPTAIEEDPALIGHYLETIEKNLAELSFMMAESKKGKPSLSEEEINYQTKLSQAQLFFYQLKLRLLDYAQTAHTTSQKEFNFSIKEEVAEVRKRLKEELLSFPISEPKQASLQRSVHLILASSYLNFPLQDWQEIEALIEHSFYAQFYAALRKESDPSAEQGAKSALFSLLPLINDPSDLSKLAPVFNRILENIYGIPISSLLSWELEFPICKTNLQGTLYEMNLLTGEVKKDGVRLNQLEAIYEDPDYQHAFGSKRFLSSSIIPQSDTNIICYEVLDERGQPIHFFVPKQQEFPWQTKEDKTPPLRMERIIDGVPYVYLSWQKAPGYPQWPTLPKHPNKDHYILWQSLEDSHIRVVDKQSQEVAYLFTTEGKIQEPSGQIKEWIDIEKVPDSKALAHFDSPSYIFALQDDQNQDISLNFCRYCDSQGSPLKFIQKMVERGDASETDEKTAIVEPKLVWESDPQFFISQKQELAGIPNYHQFLILENASGQKKALIPIKAYSTEKNASFEGPPFTFEYEVIDLAGNKLNPKTPKQHAISAYLSLMHRNYEDAFSHLEKAYHLQRYKPDDLKYLGWIIHSQEENADFDPNAIAVRNYASWLVSDNLFRNPRLISTKQTTIETPAEIKSLYQNEGDWEDYLSGNGYWKRMPNLSSEPSSKNSFADYASHLYKSYLNIRKNVNGEFRLDSSKKGKREARLTPQQEIIWLQNLLKIYYNEQLALRFTALAELEQFDSDFKTYAPFVQITSPEIALLPIKDSYSRSSTSSFLGSQIAKTPTEAVKAVLEIFPRTRPGKGFLDHFLNFYLIATKGNEEQKKVLLHLLYDMRHEPNPQNQGYRALLEAIILQHPLSSGIMKCLDALKEGRIRDEKTAFQDLEKLANRYLQSKDVLNSDHPYLVETERRIKLATSYIPDLPSPPSSFPIEEDRLSLAFSPDLRKIAREKAAIGQSSYKKIVSPKDHAPFPKYEPTTFYGQERYRKLLEDYQEGCKKSDEATSFVFSQAIDFKRWKAELEKQEIEEITAPLFLFENLIKLANKAPAINEKPPQYLSHQLKQIGRKQASVSFPDLLAAFAQQSKAGYQKLNPSLSETEVEELHNMIGSFIVNSLDLRQNKNKITVIDKIIQQIESDTDADAIKETMQELGELMELDAADEAYLTSAPLLVFHYLMNKQVRPDQINDLKTMLGVESLDQVRSQFPNLFTQKIMGGGKTLVLGTLMALLKADGYHLSILIPPPSLYDTNAQDMKIRSDKLFGQKTETFMYKRDPAYFNIAYLTNGYQMLVQAIEKKSSIILSPESLEAMENEYWGKREELRLLYQARAELLGAENHLEAERIDQQIQAISRPLKVLKETLKLIKARGVFTFDEVDLTLNCRKELNFPIGDSISLPRQANEILADLFLLAATDRDILQAGLRLRENKQSELQPVQYEKIKETLSRKFLARIIASDKWCERLFLDQEVLKKYQSELLRMEERPLENSLNEMIKKSASVLKDDELLSIYTAFGPNPSLEDIEKFFSGRSFSLPQLKKRLGLAREYGNLQFITELHAFITDLDKPAPAYLHTLYHSNQPMKKQAADLYTLLRQELNEWLQESWKKSAGEHYGFSRIQSTKLIAIPYSANNKPSENSEFADPWETANRTLQLYLSNGLKFEQTIEFIENLQKKVRFEWSQAGYPPQTSDMPTAQAFFKATGLELLAINRGQTDRIHQVQQALLKGEETGLSLMLAYVVDHVLPTIKIYPEQITHNAQNLASMPKVKQGYTGTMESADTFPDDVQVNLDKGTNGKVLEVLLRANKTVHVVEEGNVQDHLKQVLGWPNLTNPHAAQFRALIDLGPIYKGCSSEQIATDILAFMRNHPDQAMHAVQGVLYWDDVSNMLCCIKSGEAEPITLPATDPDTIFSFTGLKQEQLFAFYPHHKLTGADLVLPKDAYILPTFSNTTPLRDVLQGDMRARGLFKNQHLETMLLRSTLPMIGDEIGKPHLPQQAIETTPDPSLLSIADLIPFAEFNEAERQRMDYPRSTLQKISNHIKEAVLRELYKAESDEEENRLFEKARHLAIRKHDLALFEKFAQPHGGEISSEQFLLRKADECLIPLTGYPLRGVISLNGELLPESNQLSPDLIKAYQRINQTIQHALTKLPPTMPQLGNLEWGRETTVEQLEETSTQQHQEQQTDYYVELDTFQQIQVTLTPQQERAWQAGQFQALAAGGPVFPPYPLQHSSHPAIWPLKDVLEHHSHLKKYAHCFDKSLSLSENFLRTVENADSLFTFHQKPVYNVLAILNPQTHDWETVLVTLEEAAFFKKQLAKKEKLNFPMWLLEPEGGVIQNGQAHLEDFPSTALNNLNKRLIPVLFFMGNAKSLNADRWFNHFKEWAQEDRKLKKDLLEAVILDNEGSEQRQYYQDSRLEILLSEFSPEEAFKADSPSALPEDLELGMLAANNRRITIALNLLNKASKQMDANNPVHLNTLVALTCEAIKHSSKLSEKRQARDFLITGLKQIIQLIQTEKIYSCTENLTLLEGINDPTINQLLCEISLILIKEGQIGPATQIALSQIPSFQEIKQREDLFKNPLFLQQIKTIRTSTLKILQALGEIEPTNFEQTDSIKQINQKLRDALTYKEKPLICDLVIEWLNHSTAHNLSGIEEMAIYALDPTYQIIRDRISDTYFGNKHEKDTVSLIAEIEAAFFKHPKSMPALANKGKELLESVVKSVIDHYDKTPNPSCIPLARDFYKSGNSFALKIAKDLLKQFKKTPEWKRCSIKEVKWVNRILQSTKESV